MILGLPLPPQITPQHVELLASWLRGRATRLRPWVETYVAAEAAREGIEVPDGATLTVFDAVLTALDQLVAWPELAPATLDGARAWYRAESRKGNP